jgi:hypothetical protein
MRRARPASADARAARRSRGLPRGAGLRRG